MKITVLYPGMELSEQDAILLHTVFLARKAVFIDRLKWEIPGQTGNIERDQFEDIATHIIVTDDDKYELLGYMRLLPTTGPHLLSDVAAFADLVDSPPRGDHVWEVTRLFILRRNAEVAPYMREVLRAWGRVNGVTEFVAEVDKFVLSRLEKWGWHTNVISKAGAQWPVVIIK